MFYLFIVLVINVEGRTSDCRVKHFMSKERREKILKRLDRQKHHMTNTKTKTKTLTYKHNMKKVKAGSNNSQYKITGIDTMGMLH